MAFPSRVVSIACLFAAVSAYRLRKRKDSDEQAFFIRRRRTFCPEPVPGKGKLYEKGDVDYLITFGAPGGASPGFQHQTNEDGVFPGLRTWARNGDVVDIVTSITSAIWLWHPLMDAQSIEKGGEPIQYPASHNTTQIPSTILTSIPLHLQWEYWETTAQRNCKSYQKWSMFANNVSYAPEPGHAAMLARRYGWNVVGTAWYDGSGSIIGGPQASHLLQHPDTLECVVTFQGTQSRRDWYSNLAIRPTHFCGLVEEDEECGLFSFDTCTVRKPRGSFVHTGFADTLRRMVSVNEWQTEVRDRLGRCSSVYAAGHSLGGAVASVFATCVSQDLKPGDYGFEDYKMLYWTKRTALKLKATTPWQDPYWPGSASGQM